jgi:acetyl-CoA acetyltransferase
MAAEVFILGGAQTDFARNIEREGGGMFELFRDVAEAAFAATGIEPRQVETAHVGNFVGKLFAGQGQLGGFFGHVHPVGATGVRMTLDAWRQVTGNAGDYQVEGATNFATFNVGGSATTSDSFVVGV